MSIDLNTSRVLVVANKNSTDEKCSLTPQLYIFRDWSLANSRGWWILSGFILSSASRPKPVFPIPLLAIPRSGEEIRLFQHRFRFAVLVGVTLQEGNWDGWEGEKRDFLNVRHLGKQVLRPMAFFTLRSRLFSFTATPVIRSHRRTELRITTFLKIDASDLSWAMSWGKKTRFKRFSQVLYRESISHAMNLIEFTYSGKFYGDGI